MKRIFTFFLALLMIVSVLPVTALQAYATEVEESTTPTEEVQPIQAPQPETCEHTYAQVVTPPTCTEQGYTTHTCANCGHSYADTYVEAPGHSCVKRATVRATQTKDGYIAYECENCNYSYKDTLYAPGLPSVTPTSDDYELIWGMLVEADYYEVWRATSKNGTFVKVADAPHAFWRDPNVTMGKTYYYKLRSMCTARPELSSNFGKVYALTYKCSMPQLKGQIDSVSGGIELYWGAINGAKKYDIYRSTSAKGSYKKIGSTSNLSYIDASGTVGKVYYYKIRAVASNSKYNSEYSEILYGYSICAQPQVTVTLDAATGQPKLTWEKVKGAESYVIARYIPELESAEILTTQAGCSFIDTTAPSEKMCFYVVQALGTTEETSGYPSDDCYVVSGMVTPVVEIRIDGVSGKPVLTWNAIEGALKYNIYRSTKSSSGYTVVATVEELTYTDETVSAGKTYYYKVEAVGAVSKSAQTSYLKVTGKCSTPVISVENGSSGKPVVSWEKVSGAKQYTVYVATAQNGTYKKLGTSKTLSYTDSKAKSGNTYFYKVIANGSKSTYDSGYSNIVSCGVICGTPSVSVKVDANTGKPTLSWKKVDAATGYAIYRDGELLTTVTAVTYADTTAAIDTQYSYAVQALGKTEDLNGSLSKAVSVTSGIAKPKLTGKVNAEGQPILTWDAVEGAVKYEIYRSTKSSKSYKLVATVETLTYGDDAFAAGTAYYYKVKAIGAVSKSAESSYVKLTGKCATPVISAEAGQSGKPKISWEKVTGAKQYTVYRATSENGKYSKLGTTKSNTYEDKKASVGKTYFYKVIANGSKSSGNSAYSNIVSCSVRLAAPKIKSYGPNDVYGDPLISWEKVSGAKGYRILRKLPGETEFKVIKEWNETYFRDMDAPLFAECTYIMQTIGSKPEYDSVYTQEMTILSTMGQPNVTCLSKNNGASLTWYAVEGAVSYDVFVSDTKDGAFTLLLNTKSTGYLHTDAQPNRDYYYKVVAIGESGLRVEGYVNKLCIRCATPRVTLELDAVSGKPVLSWEAVDGATKGYEIYRATSGGKLKKLKTVKTLRFVDTSATPGGDYRYEVRALGSGKDYNSKWEETGYIAAKCAQPKATVKLNKSGDPVVSWKKVSGAKQYMVMYVDVTDFVLSGTEPSESYLQQHMQYVQTSKTSVTLTKAESDRVYIITMIAVPKNQECFSTPSDPVIVITE